MKWGLPQAPRWAWITMAAAAVTILVLTVVAFQRWTDATLDPGVAARADAEAAQRAAERSAARAAEEEAAREAERVKVAVPADRPLEVLFAGDSITFGQYATRADLTFAARVTAGLAEQAQVNVTNTAVPGHTVSQGLEQPVPGTLDLAVVMFGNNDVERSDPDTFARDYAVLLDRLRAVDPSLPIVCVTPWMAPGYSVGDNVAADFRRIVLDVCDAEGIAVADAMPYFDGGRRNAQVGDPKFNGGTAPDSGHPNDEGHQVIAELVLDQISVQASTG